MSYNSTTKIISSPVAMSDVRTALNTSEQSLKPICNHANIKRWAKYKPVSLADEDTVTGQWDFTNLTWLTSARWWHGDRTSGSNFERECGFKIPSVRPSAEYRSAVYYYDDRLAPNVYTTPASMPTAVWQYEARPVGRLSDFAKYYNEQLPVPVSIIYPESPLRVSPTAAEAFVVKAYMQNLSIRDKALAACDFDLLGSASFCIGIRVLRYENNTLVSTKEYEVDGGTISENSTTLIAYVMQKLLKENASDGIHTDVVTVTPYFRKMENSLPVLLSSAFETAQSRTLTLIFSNNTYKMRFLCGELDNALISGMFTAGYSASLSDISLYPTVDEDAVTTTTSGFYFRIGGLFAKAIINDVYNIGLPAGPFTANVYVEDLNEGDYLKCIIPKTRILSFTITAANSLQGYGFRGTSDGTYAGDTTMAFANALNNAGQWPRFDQQLIPILNPFGTEEVWPPGPLNPDNDVIAKFRLSVEITGTDPTVVSVPQNGSGSYQKTDSQYDPYTQMAYWRTGYIFDVRQYTDSETQEQVIDVVPDPDVCGTVTSLDSSEVATNLGTSAWLPLPSGWDTTGSTWLTE